MNQNILERAKRVKALILDIDGVMTDGRIIYSIYGDELKFFDVQDGLGIALLRRAGIKVFIITAKKSKIVKTRAKDLKVERAYQGFSDKTIPFNRILKAYGLAAEEVCFIGDDLIDIPVLKRAGLAVAVSNAADDAKARVHFITSKPGGRGAVREVCDIILKAQDKWSSATADYLK